MPELERLADVIEWPATPSFALPAAQPRRRRALVPALVAAVLLAVAVAFAVPDARSAILRFFHLGGVTVERVDTLPPAQHRALVDALGVPVSRTDAAVLLGEPFREPAGALYRDGGVISTLLDGDILLSELQTQGGSMVLKKFAAGATDVSAVDLGVPAVWVRGKEHVYMSPTLPSRFAGNTLLWQDGPITFRLEGRGLTLGRAKAIARSLLR
jgi:hypothetical protein